MSEPTLNTLSPDNLKAALANGNITLIDVRDDDEYRIEHLSASQLIPMDILNPQALKPLREQAVALICQSGKRSEQAARKLIEAGFTQVSHLSGGINAWKQSGGELVQNAKAPISLFRQVQIIAGSCVLAGTLLGYFVSPWFLLLSGFFGAGLTFAGITGFCGLGMMLMKLPYNQR